MRKLLAIICLAALFPLCLAAAEDRPDNDMTNAQLRFIMENARLSKKEYQRFAKIYIKYVDSLYELNNSAMSKPSDGPSFGMPFDFHPDNRQQQEYMRKWNEINEEYRSAMERQLSEDACHRIADAQWKLGQKIWEEWMERSRKEYEQQMEKGRKEFEQQMEKGRKEMERHWTDIINRQGEWWNHYWRSWGDSLPRRDGHWYNHF